MTAPLNVNEDFWKKIEVEFKKGTIISTRCNKKIEEAQAKYSFLEQSTNNDSSVTEEIVLNDECNVIPLKSKGFFNIFSSSSLTKIYDIGAKSFSLIKDTASNIITNITDTFNLISNKVFSSSPINPDEQLIEEILSTSENELDEVFEDITYEKLADLINNAPNEKVQKLVNYILPWHLEKVINLISPDKLKKLFDTNAGGLTLDEITEEQLNKLSDKNTSDEKIKDIIVLVDEEDLVKHITKNSNFIPSKNLETIFANISSENGIEILKFLENSSELLGAAAAA